MGLADGNVIIANVFSTRRLVCFGEGVGGAGEAVLEAFGAGLGVHHPFVGAGFLVAAKAGHKGFVLGRGFWLRGRRRDVDAGTAKELLETGG